MMQVRRRGCAAGVCMDAGLKALLRCTLCTLRTCGRSGSTSSDSFPLAGEGVTSLLALPCLLPCVMAATFSATCALMPPRSMLDCLLDALGLDTCNSSCCTSCAGLSRGALGTSSCVTTLAGDSGGEARTTAPSSSGTSIERSAARLCSVPQPPVLPPRGGTGPAWGSNACL